MVKNKKKIIILNKSDLADDIQTKKWKEYLTDNDTIAISMNSLNNNRVNEIINTLYLQFVLVYLCIYSLNYYFLILQIF